MANNLLDAITSPLTGEYRKEKPLSVQMAETGLEMTPVGTALEVGEELSSDKPSWLNIGLAVAPDVLGLGPVADPLMKAIKGTKFKTAKGSTYEVKDNNTTVRDKAARPEHPGESGVQPQSVKTIYMPRSELEKFAGTHQNPEIGTEFIPTGTNTAALRYTEDYGPRKAGEIVPGTEVTFTLEPEVGLNPVEILDFKNPKGIHFGNEIIEVESNIPKVSKNYAEGGVAMDEQMDAVFKSSRTEVDPVSGNEVPPGSLPEEVRDDIPAMLSEGEYVVPADVLRFYGVKFFEDLRAQAKMGLAEMEANGRIGGEPIEEETGDVGISDEDLMVIMAQAPQEEQAVGAANGGLMGFQTGGLNVPAYIKQPDLTQFGMAGPDFQGGLEYRPFTNDAGMTITIPFFNGEPMGMIPPGYTEGEAPTTTEQAAPQVSRDSGSEGSAKRARESFEASQRKEESIDYTNPQSVSEAVDEYYAGSAAPGLIGVLAPGVGLAATGIRYLQKNNLIKGIDEQLNNTELDSDKAKSLSQLKQELQDKDVYRERVGTKGFGEKIRDFFGLDGESSRPDYSSSLTNLGGPEKDLEWMGSERDAYNAAVERGDDNVVQHFESINRLRDKQNTFADKGLSRAEGAAMGLSESDMDSAEKYGGSLQRAKDAGEVEKSGGFFSSYEKVEKEDENDE
jgi:hypothetical protein